MKLNKIFLLVAALFLSVSYSYANTNITPCGGIDGRNYVVNDSIQVKWDSTDYKSNISIYLWDGYRSTKVLLKSNISRLSCQTKCLIPSTTVAGSRFRIIIQDASNSICFSSTFFQIINSAPKESDFTVNPEPKLKLFPNPTNGIVNLPIDNIVKIDVYSIDGVLVNSFESVSSQIDISNLPSGSYNLVIYKDDSSIVNTSVIKL